jgi:phosphotriesterase-related protein
MQEVETMPVMTVLGPVEKDSLGVILPHEHLFIDLTNQFTEFDDPVAASRSREPISLANYGYLRRNPYALKENLIMDDPAVTAAEALCFKGAGGSTIVDCTSVGINRSPLLLRALAEETGLNIVAGCGYYTQDTHPAELTGWSKEQIADEMVHDLTEEIGDTGVRAGVIGEIGTSMPIHPDEMKSLEAAALAHARTGAPIQVHTYPWGTAGNTALDVLCGLGVDPARVVICHTDVAFDVPYIRSLLRRGAFVEFDNFGKEFYIDSRDRVGFTGGVFARDLERVHVIRELVDEGFAGQILVTNDLCLKQMLHRYGGWGFDHILTNIVPMMVDEGIPEETAWSMVSENPARWLCG